MIHNELVKKVFESKYKELGFELLKKSNIEYKDLNDQDFFNYVKQNKKKVAYGQDSKRGQKRAKDILFILKKCPNRVVNYLDIGCNQGENTIEVKKILHLKDENTFGIDIQSFSGKEIEPKPGFTFSYYDGVEIPFSKQFDLVSILQVLHHVENRNEFMKSLARVVKRNGIVILREHDCIDNEFADLIDFEHFLYGAEEVNYEVFTKTYYSNYFSRQELIHVFHSFGFRLCYQDKTFGPTNYYYLAFRKI